MYSRILAMDLPPRQSAFLWGARKTGKSTFLTQKFPEAIYFDLLDYKVFDGLNREPFRLREEIAGHSPAAMIIVDEVQKIPPLLDEVHYLIENQGRQFILCGSSARKLKRGQANLLGGRAWRYHMLPLSAREIPNFDLLRALQRGLLPAHYDSADVDRALEGYVLDYLKEEIQAEALTRNLRAFSQFLDTCAFSNCEIINYSNFARDVGVDAKTIKQYFQILEDTLIGYYVYPFQHHPSRKDIVSTPKFYLFDVGVANYLAKRKIQSLRGGEAGKAFEHLVFMELWAYIKYHKPREEICYWRTKTGLEVDFVTCEGKVAIEVKVSDSPSRKDLHGLSAYLKDYKNAKGLIVCPEARKRVIDFNHAKATLVSWHEFTSNLWDGQIL
ncbi:MAG: ATP-binding protein [Deltaproteobacteria bacterium]|nr:ATP-binding protein [Deltaproteobacteria bacterium]